MRRSSTKHKDRKLFLILTFIVLVVLILGLVIFSPLNVKEVEVKADMIDCASSEELKTTADLLGKNILLVDEQTTEKKLKDKYLCIRKIKIDKKLPNEIILNVSGRQPVAILVETKNEQVNKIEISTSSGEASVSAEQASSSAMFNFVGGGDLYLVDDEGMIFAKNISKEAPKIYFEGIVLSIGKKIEEGVVKNALKIQDRVKIFGVNVNEAKIYSQNTLLVNSAPKMIFSLNSGIDLQLAALQLLLEQAKINEENMEFIDLRFEKPIVKYAPKKKN